MNINSLNTMSHAQLMQMLDIVVRNGGYQREHVAIYEAVVDRTDLDELVIDFVAEQLCNDLGTLMGSSISIKRSPLEAFEIEEDADGSKQLQCLFEDVNTLKYQHNDAMLCDTELITDDMLMVACRALASEVSVKKAIKYMSCMGLPRTKEVIATIIKNNNMV